uniref:Parkin co-regulated protein-like protein n=1 Tax=Coptotermes formosanus TaxID=36987 RepID=R4V1C3_COPFO|nr:parkin co-regulated protein-like protein [Coptotermes formosanus]
MGNLMTILLERPRLGKTDEQPPMKQHGAQKKKNTGQIVTRGIGLPPKPKPSKEYTQFKRFYDRGDLPITRNFGNQKDSNIHWKVSPDLLDYHHYLPLFFDGLRETEEPYWFFAFYGSLELINQGPKKIVSVVPQLILPLKAALNTKEPIILCRVMEVFQTLVHADPMISEALVPYYRQLLPVFAEYILSNKNLGDRIEYSQRKKINLGDLIMETLEEMEKTGGPDAFINIKYMIPTYQSALAGTG